RFSGGRADRPARRSGVELRPGHEHGELRAALRSRARQDDDGRVLHDVPALSSAAFAVSSTRRRLMQTRFLIFAVTMAAQGAWAQNYIVQSQSSPYQGITGGTQITAWTAHGAFG